MRHFHQTLLLTELMLISARFTQTDVLVFLGSGMGSCNSTLLVRAPWTPLQRQRPFCRKFIAGLEHKSKYISPEAQLINAWLNLSYMCWSFSHWSWWQISRGVQQSGVESIQKLFFPEQLCNNQWICKLLTLTHWNNLGLSFHFALIGLTLHLSLPKWVALPKICAGMFVLSEGTWWLN